MFRDSRLTQQQWEIIEKAAAKAFQSKSAFVALAALEKAEKLLAKPEN